MAEMTKVLGFGSSALEDPEETLQVMAVDGVEELSRLFRFELDLISKEKSFDTIKLLKESAWLSIKQGVKLAGGTRRGLQTLAIHGVLSHFEQLEARQDTYRYRAVLVPRLWRSTLSYQSRIFMDKTTPEIIEEILTSADNGYQLDVDFSKLTKKDDTSVYPRREFVMQYEETDFDFISRWMEHEGIFYYFDHADGVDKIFFCDDKSAYPPMQGDAEISYRPHSQTIGRVEARESEDFNDDWFAEEVIGRISCEQTRIPAKVALKDYNYRSPSDPLKVEADVSQDGFGLVYEYNNHYKNEGEGKNLAKVRCEEILSREVRLTGLSDCRSFRAGATFHLVDHFADFNDKDYLLLRITHKAEQDIDLDSDAVMHATYTNEFEAMPADRTFRPERTAPWPKIAGFLNAKVDGNAGDYAEIDEEGRYKVKLPLDLSDRSTGSASRYVRMMQPYAGGGMGMHFPLHVGTEVAIFFVEGDPDRPLIAGAVPNPETASVVTGGNNTQCVMHTGGGNAIVFEDTGGGQRIAMSSPVANTYISIGAPPA